MHIKINLRFPRSAYIPAWHYIHPFIKTIYVGSTPKMCGIPIQIELL
jgi:hypothetical protein